MEGALMAPSPIPEDVHLFVCMKCARTDRFAKMGQQHFASGRRCDGKVVRVRYRFAGIVREGAD